jgi:hypothetical protein
MTGSYFYATGDDKAGNLLITSYKKEDQAKKYRAGCEVFEGLKYLDVVESKVTGNYTGLLLRTLIAKRDASEKMAGNFVIYARINGEWFQTEFRYGTYSAANTAVKGALIQLYDACAVIEEDD